VFYITLENHQVHAACTTVCTRPDCTPHVCNALPQYYVMSLWLSSLVIHTYR